MAETSDFKMTSQYLAMRDGVRIAVDLYLPRAARSGGKVPTIIKQTRYQRNVEYRKPFDMLFKKWLGDVSYETRMYFLAHGYAWMDVDARGSGASFGKRPSPWYEDETLDGADVVDWIIRQGWSNGLVGSTGISYEGTTAEMLLVNRHPAVKAVIPQFSLFDAFTDIAFPGGIHQFFFTSYWDRMNQGFDRNNAHEMLGMWLGIMARGTLEKKIDNPALSDVTIRAADRLGIAIMKTLVNGVRPADCDVDRKLLEQAVADHTENFNMHGAALEITFRDDGVISPLVAHKGPTSIDSFSPHSYIDKINTSGAAVFSYGGWWDTGYQHAAIKRQMTLTNPDNRMMIGAWDHAGRHEIGRSEALSECHFDHNAEFLQFFDHHLKGKDTGIGDVARVRYYTMVEEKWKSADTWPPPNAETMTLYFAPRQRLETGKPAADSGEDRYRVDYTAGSGDLSRWKSGVGISIDYTDRKQRDKKLLVYDSQPLDRDVEVTGHPVVTLFVVSDATDGSFIAYLEDVTPGGDVRYVTEGCLRAVHRKVSRAKPPYSLVVPYHSFKRADAMPLTPGKLAEITFDLLPTSYLFKRRHSIRIAIAGADRHHHAIPPGPPPTIHIQRTKKHSSHIALPVVQR